MRKALVCAAAASLLLLACRDECTAETFNHRCEGNVLVTCPTPGVDQIVPVRISRKDCEARFCVAPDGVPFCASAATPSALCADAGTSACEDATTYVYCTRGFETYRTACRVCGDTDAGVTCEGGPSARCTSSAECAATLSCRDAGHGSYCRE